MIHSRRAGIVFSALVFALSTAAWATDPDPDPAPSPAPQASTPAATPAPAPLQFHLGEATFTPLGFMDFTSVFRSASEGTGIGTNFGSIPYNTNTAAKLTEERLSIQNSRIGMRVDADVKGSHVMGYWESDFLGNVNGQNNTSVSSNSYTFRLRLFFVDVKKGQFEVLGGQSWSLITPGRKGISPLPGDIFYSQDVDVNYNVGLTWGRIPQLRLVYHPTDQVAAAISFENPDQYIGGSGGGGAIVFPTTGNFSTAYVANELDNGATGATTTTNTIPDVIGKLAFDPKTGSTTQHIELVGLLREFKVFSPGSATNVPGSKFTATGAGVALNMNFALSKNFHFVTNNFYGDGGGRYLFGTGPDLIVRGDGSLSPIHDVATVTGFEVNPGPNTLLYAYYGDAYFGKNVAIDTAGKYVGYGCPIGVSGCGNAQNRNIQEGTFGLTQTFWKSASYGALSFMLQYAYYNRDPWVAVLAAGGKSAHNSTVFMNLRYTLPGTAPPVK
jgi:hypothetical protein